MRLLRFRVTNFRSVNYSGWIEAGDITALIGTNESGKTNILVPLWKLNPAREGEIDPIADYPRKRYGEIRDMTSKPVFIEADFELETTLATQIADLTDMPVESVRSTKVKRDLAGKYFISFPDALPPRSVSPDDVGQLLAEAREAITSLEAFKSEETLKAEILVVIERALTEMTAGTEDGQVDRAILVNIQSILSEVDLEQATKRSTLSPRYGRLLDDFGAMVEAISIPRPSDNANARKLVLDSLPSFVYYSNYGNLDSEIYLPHVIANMQRTDLGAKEQAKVRTLRVLFNFVRLKPQEILELGRDLDEKLATEAQIEAAGEKKKEREILLQSASTALTGKFREWWRQGDYRFRFDADGSHFRIWVSDDRRPEEIELEGRSAGLQWFISFYLVFLVESEAAHKGTILLLDEPGLTLHPLAQKDLSAFFENLARTNQILYTTHSLHMIDPDHLDRVRAVYVDEEGTTRVSSDLRAGETDPSQTHSIYPVQAAIGLTTADAYLYGSHPAIVEGTSDQYYLSAIKTYLIARGHITPTREIAFIPAGGAKGIKTTAPTVAGRAGELPPVILDSDRQGIGVANDLKSGLYAHSTKDVIQVGDLIAMENVEVEDLFPTRFLAAVVSRKLRGPSLDYDFDEVVVEGKPIVPQIEAYAVKYGIPLAKGWKVEIAKLTKARLLREEDSPHINDTVVERWKDLFGRMGV